MNVERRKVVQGRAALELELEEVREKQTQLNEERGKVEQGSVKLSIMGGKKTQLFEERKCHTRLSRSSERKEVTDEQRDGKCLARNRGATNKRKMGPEGRVSERKQSREEK